MKTTKSRTTSLVNMVFSRIHVVLGFPLQLDPLHDDEFCTTRMIAKQLRLIPPIRVFRYPCCSSLHNSVCLVGVSIKEINRIDDESCCVDCRNAKPRVLCSKCINLIRVDSDLDDYAVQHHTMVDSVDVDRIFNTIFEVCPAPEVSPEYLKLMDGSCQEPRVYLCLI